MPMQLDPTNPINNTVEEDRQDLIEAIGLIKELYELVVWDVDTKIRYANLESRARAFVDKFEE